MLLQAIRHGEHGIVKPGPWPPSGTTHPPAARRPLRGGAVSNRSSHYHSPSLTTPTLTQLPGVSTPSMIRGSCAIRAPQLLVLSPVHVTRTLGPLARSWWSQLVCGAPFPTQRSPHSPHLVSPWRRPIPRSVLCSNPSHTAACLSAGCDTRPRLAGAASGPCHPPTSVVPAWAMEAPMRPAATSPVLSRYRPRWQPERAETLAICSCVSFSSTRRHLPPAPVLPDAAADSTAAACARARTRGHVATRHHRRHDTAHAHAPAIVSSTQD